MTGLSALWLPILLSSVLVFLVSFLLHMVLPWHKGDFSKVPNEDKARDALRGLAIPPGNYMTPYCTSAQEMKSPEFAEKMKQGPVMMITVMPPGPMNITTNLVQWFLYLIVVGIFAAYVAGRALAPGTDYLAVFRFAGVTAFLGYSLALVQGSIWNGRAWGATMRHLIDGLLYGLITAGTFGWLWPQ
jgi:hypothetical protein